ncbi:uncharacterized protein LOC133791628 [Humulus lupulus]|uniref:uncharacterized protein LOC133791628 n=1 Tax=Humulus lupulus TaxID=3486 RepID=UPI002B40BE3C|nr:uncharacterized protein LOC133791628 [Humulus lupulus]
MGLTMIKFNDEATRDQVLESGILHFDRKPVIIRPWSPDLSAFRLIRSVPLWIRLQDLGLQYWGSKCLSALVSTLGKPIMVDKFTRERSRVQFARVLVEMAINDNPPRTIQFLNEHGQLVEQGVEYEWLPMKCKACAGFGHSMAECRKEQKVQGNDSLSLGSEPKGRDKGKEATEVSDTAGEVKEKEGSEASAGTSSGLQSNTADKARDQTQKTGEVVAAENGQRGPQAGWQSPKKMVYRKGKDDRRQQRDKVGLVDFERAHPNSFVVLQDQVERGKGGFSDPGSSYGQL